MEKFLADESVDFRLVIYLRDEEFKVEAIVEMNPGISDEEVLVLANELESILLTEDKDFGELTYRLQKPNQGIVLIRLSGVSIEEKVRIIEQVVEDHIDELRGKFTVLTKDKIRIKDQK
ncbi:MAG: hypothetical protein GYB31_06650 [Bacteroidetes bacterium]|nr:hypothetical protein [Bacteroidota bacterium]